MFITTKSSRLKENAEKSFESLSYESHKSKKRKEESAVNKLNETNVTEVDKREMRKYWNEIMNFGATGFDKAKKRETKIAVAVSLGAKPPKRSYRNYKEILEEKKRSKEETERLKELLRKGKADPGAIYRKQNSKSKPRKKKEMTGMLNVYGKVNKHLKRAAKQDQAKS